MNTQKQTATAAGPTAWIPIDYKVAGFGLTIGCVVSSNATLTYKVQYTHDNPYGPPINCNITRSATTATVTTPANHGLTTNDSVTIIGSGDPNLDGTYTVASVVSQSSFTYTVSNTGATQSAASVGYIPMRVFDHTTITGQTANKDSNIAFPVRAVRLNVTAFTAGYVTMILNEGPKS